jgi:hypothetical protein
MHEATYSTTEEWSLVVEVVSSAWNISILQISRKVLGVVPKLFYELFSTSNKQRHMHS